MVSTHLNLSFQAKRCHSGRSEESGFSQMSDAGQTRTVGILRFAQNDIRAFSTRSFSHHFIFKKDLYRPFPLDTLGNVKISTA